MQHMTLRELIDELTELAKQFGENTEVVSKSYGSEDPPMISAGPPPDGGPVVVKIF